HGAAAIVFCTDSQTIHEQLERTERRLEAVKADLEAAVASYQEIAEPTERQEARHQRKMARLQQRQANIEARLEQDREGLLEFSGAGSAIDGGRLPVLACSRSAVERLLSAAG